MTDFELADHTSRAAFELYAAHNETIANITHQEDPWSWFDSEYMSGTTSVIAELKLRPMEHTTTFPGKPEGFILERDKYNSLKKILAANPGKEIVYINIFTDAVVIFSLTNSNFTDWKKNSFNKTNVGDRKQVEKEVVYLKLSEASHIFKHKTNIKSIEELVRFTYTQKKS